MRGAERWTTILVRYGEIGIKSPSVRARFEKRLHETIEEALAARGVEAQVTRSRGRVFVRALDVSGALAALSRTFGVVSASPATELPAELPALVAAAADATRGAIAPGQSFAVRARRAAEKPFTSMDVQREVGAAVWRANADAGPRVNLEAPDVELHFEIREDVTYLYREIVAGPGGLPVGSQGRVTVLLDSPNAVLAAWLSLRRGCSVFHVAPAPLDAATREALERLLPWSVRARGRFVPAPDDPARRRALLLAVAARETQRRRGHALIAGDGLAGTVAYGGLDAIAGFPVFRPLLGFPGARLGALSRQTGIPAAEETLPAVPFTAAPPEAEEVRAALAQSTALTLDLNPAKAPKEARA